MCTSTLFFKHDSIIVVVLICTVLIIKQIYII
jgi:hypothetical protein